MDARERGRAHERRAKKYLQANNARKAAAHFARAMRYFGAKPSLVGFVVSFVYEDKEELKVYFETRSLFRILCLRVPLFFFRLGHFLCRPVSTALTLLALRKTVRSGPRRTGVLARVRWSVVCRRGKEPDESKQPMPTPLTCYEQAAGGFLRV
jgi:hypothetical protein